MKWFFNWKISTKLISCFIVVAIIAGVVGVVGISSLRTLDTNDTELYTKMTVPLATSSNMSRVFQSVRVNLRNMILENDISRIQEQYEANEKLIAELNTYSEDFSATIEPNSSIAKAFDDFMDTRANFRKYFNELYELCLENKDEEAYALILGDMKGAAEAEGNAIDKLVDMKVEEARVKSETNSLAAKNAEMTMIVIIVCGVIMAIGLGIFISHIISSPLKKLTKAAGEIADGNLDVEFDIDTKDEIGILTQSFTKMTANLNDVMSNIVCAAEQVAAGSQQVSDSSVMLSEGATEQASSVEQLTVSLDNIATQTRKNAETANQANELAENTKQSAEKGNQEMQEMLNAMDQINDGCSNISRIIKVIEDIAFQTNMLALNAAVEAARAGSAGRGFSVVAEEVRNLAARSANAAKETTAMIEGSIKKADEGTKIANQTADALKKIVKGIEKVATLVGSISEDSNEQASGISQVNQGIMQVSVVVQSNSATAEESSAASEELAEQAEKLKDQVSRFKLKNK